MSQLVGKTAEDRNAASMMLDIFVGSKDKTAAAVAGTAITDTSRLSRQKYAVLAANTGGRAREILREGVTKNGA